MLGHSSPRLNHLLPPLGDINVVVVTDVHSWVGGHGRHEPSLDADYGDVLSFYQTLEKIAHQSGRDVFFVMNGDFVDGTGLSTVPPDRLTPILQRMPFDAVNLGNHELYHNETVEFLRDSGFIDHWSGNYLTTNTLWKESGDYLGHPYTYLYGQQSHTKILSFGFLYNFESNCESTVVRKVQETTKMDWFRQVLLRQDYDAILVLAHMDVIDPLVGHIHRSIRSVVGPDMPIQFINGHSHRRGVHTYDQTCTGFEAGRFLDTVGFVTFPTVESVVASDSPQNLFRHAFLDANKQTLQETLGGYSKTKDGCSLTELIHETQDSLGIEDILGCAAQSYPIGRPLNSSDSLYGLYMHQVFPFAFGYNHSKVFVQSTGALRYSLLKGEVTIDDLIAVSPFEDTLYLTAQRINGSQLLAAFGDLMDTDRDPKEWPFPYVLSGPGVDPLGVYDVYTADFDLIEVRQRIERIVGQKLGPAILYGHDDGSLITTSTVWQNFVVSNWPCPRIVPSRRLISQRSGGILVYPAVAVAAFGVLISILLPSHRRRRQHVVHRYAQSGDTSGVYGSMGVA